MNGHPQWAEAEALLKQNIEESRNALMAKEIVVEVEATSPETNNSLIDANKREKELEEAKRMKIKQEMTDRIEQNKNNKNDQQISGGGKMTTPRN